MLARSFRRAHRSAEPLLSKPFFLYSDRMKLDPGIIAMDLDDTLLRHDLTISDRTVATLERAAKNGVKIMLASGRAPEAMIPYAERIGIDRQPSFLICNNGAQVITSDTHATVFEHKLPEDVALEAFRLTVAAGLSCHVYENDIIHVSRETEYSERDWQLSGLKPVVPADFEELIRQGVYKLVIPGDPEFIVPIEAEFKVIFADRAIVFVSKPYFLEVLPLNAGKGDSLREVAERILGIPRERVMAFGDSMNDESMIRYAGLSVAMSNSRPEILALAKHRTIVSNDDDGIADFLEKYAL
jgi:Cof subfamily protein (haloacid dehalogenase superfamily)